MSGPSRWRWVAALVALATLVGVALRFVDLGLRPIHHDEAVNWFRFASVVRKGGYAYDPANYHGPLHFQVGALARELLGTSLTATRVPLALVGCTMAPMVWGLRRRLGDLGTVTAAAVFATSPLFVYYSRDAIHEVWLAAATLAGAIAAVRWFDSPGARARDGWALATGLSLGVGIAIKETVVISGAGLVAGAALAAAVHGIERDRPWGRFAALVGAGAALVVVLSYSNGLTDSASLLRLVESLNIWAARGAEGAGHDKPAPYFLKMIWRYEPHLLVLAAAGVVMAVRRRDGLALAFLGWAAVQLGVYAAIAYKTPWLVVQMTLPLVLLAASAAPRGGGQGLSVGFAAVLAVLAGGATWEAVRLSFVDYDRRGEMVVYVQTTRELVQVMEDFEAVVEGVGEGAAIRSFFHARYPMNWYLRDRPLRRHKDAEPWPEVIRGDGIMVSPKEEPDLLAHLDEPHLRKQIWFRNDSKMVALVPARHRGWLVHPDGWERVEALPAAFEPPARPDGELREGLSEKRWTGRVPRGHVARRGSWGGEDEWHDADDTKPVGAPVFVRREGWWSLADGGTWTLSTTSDDGSRLWIDGQLVVDNWGAHPTETVSGEVSLDAGDHHLRIDWFNLGGPGRLRVRVARGEEAERALVPGELGRSPGRGP